MKFFDILDNVVYGPLDYIDRIEWLFKAILYRDAGRRLAILRPDKGGKHSLAHVEELLGRYKVATYGRTFDARHHYFRVKKRQASWAEYILLRAGVELVGPMVDPANAAWAKRHPTGKPPTPWTKR